MNTRAFVISVALALAPTFAAAQAVPVPDPTGSGAPATAVPESDDTGVFVSLGGGVGTHDMAGQLSLSVAFGRHHLVVRTAGTVEFAIFAPGRSTDDVALLYGRRHGAGKSWVRLAGGPSVVTVRDPGAGYDCYWFACSYDIREESTLGLALQADAVWAPVSGLGLGITASGNLNPKDPFAALTLGVHLGKVR